MFQIRLVSLFGYFLRIITPNLIISLEYILMSRTAAQTKFGAVHWYGDGLQNILQSCPHPTRTLYSGSILTQASSPTPRASARWDDKDRLGWGGEQYRPPPAGGAVGSAAVRDEPASRSRSTDALPACPESPGRPWGLGKCF